MRRTNDTAWATDRNGEKKATVLATLLRLNPPLNAHKCLDKKLRKKKKNEGEEQRTRMLVTPHPTFGRMECCLFVDKGFYNRNTHFIYFFIYYAAEVNLSRLPIYTYRIA